MSSLVPEVWKIVKNGPWDIKTLRKTNFVLVLLICDRISPWWKSLVKLHNWSLKFKSLAVLVPGEIKMEKSYQDLILFITWQEKPFGILWNNAKFNPPTFGELQKWSL
jgi:hypothetical protein